MLLFQTLDFMNEILNVWPSNWKLRRRTFLWYYFKRLSPCMKSLKWKLQMPTTLWYCFERCSPWMTNVWSFNWTLQGQTFLWTNESVLLFQTCESVEEFLNQMKATKAFVYIVLFKIFWACVWNAKCVTRKKERYTGFKLLSPWVNS